jgi:alanine racemase
MTHFADASDRSNPMTREQLQVFNSVCAGLQGERSLANSAAVIAWPQTHGDWVRPGLMLYGVSPMDAGTAVDHDLKPVMSLVSELISVKDLRQGDPVGYGAEWRCPEAMPVGIVATGYGDGFPRHAGSGTPIIIRGIEAMIIGNTSMDMLAVDLRNIPDARVGDRVELWGPHLPVEIIARHAGTIPYEILCAVHKRLPFIEHHGES